MNKLGGEASAAETGDNEQPQAAVLEPQNDKDPRRRRRSGVIAGSAAGAILLAGLGVALVHGHGSTSTGEGQSGKAPRDTGASSAPRTPGATSKPTTAPVSEGGSGIVLTTRNWCSVLPAGTGESMFGSALAGAVCSGTGQNAEWVGGDPTDLDVQTSEVATSSQLSEAYYKGQGVDDYTTEKIGNAAATGWTYDGIAFATAALGNGKEVLVQVEANTVAQLPSSAQAASENMALIEVETLAVSGFNSNS